MADSLSSDAGLVSGVAGREALWDAVRSALQAQRDGAPLERVPRNRAPIASFAQRRLWFLERLAAGSATYCQTIAYRLTGALSLRALEASLGEIVRRHEALRTTLFQSHGELFQRIHPPTAFVIRVRDLSATPEATRVGRADEAIAQEAREPFEIERTPLLRALLVRLADDEHRLAITVHHLAFDGWSFAVFMRELRALYAAYLAGAPSPLAELRVQYADYAAWQRARLDGARLARLRDYWTCQMRGPLPVLRMPADHPRRSRRQRRGECLPFTLATAPVEALKRLAADEGATLYMTLLAALQLLLHRYTGQRDIVVGSPVANRQLVDVERLIGVVVNTLAMRTPVDGEETFRELLQRVRATVLGAYEHQDLPFEMLVDALGAAARNDATPLFQVMFAFQNLPRWIWEAPGLAVQAWNVGNGCSKFDLTLFAWEESEGIGGLLEYDADLFDDTTASEWLRHFRALLEAIGRDPDCAIAALPAIDGFRPAIAQVEPALDPPVGTSAYVPPRDARERMIVDAFEQVLDRHQIGVDRDFFDAGGDSFSALRLIEMLETTFAVDIPLVTLYEHPTAAMLAGALARLAEHPEALAARGGSSLVEIKRGRAAPPLFLIPGGHGGMAEMTLYAKALSRLRRDLQVYGVLARGIDGNERPHSSVAAMADAYIAEIRRLQPSGPYALAGECVGGLIAFEMAQRLFAQGDHVALLVLLDTWCPTLAGVIHYRYVERVATLFAARRAVARRGLAEVAQVLQDHVRDRPPFAPLKSLRYAVNVARTLVRAGRPWVSAVNAVGRPPPGNERTFAAEANYIERAMRYRPSPYPGTVSLIVSAANVRQGLVNPWRVLAVGGLVVLPVPGDHDSYLRETPEATMPALEAYIDEAFGAGIESGSRLTREAAHD